MRRLALLPLLMFAFACNDSTLVQPEEDAVLDAPDIRAAATVLHDNFWAPFSSPTFAPCANGGAGEIILTSGTLHIVAHTTISNSGNVSSMGNINTNDATAVGLTSGDAYKAGGVINERFNIKGDGLPLTNTFVWNWFLHGPVKLKFSQTIHMTVNNNGEVTAEVLNEKTTCQ